MDVFPVLCVYYPESGAQITDDGKEVGESGWERQDGLPPLGGRGRRG